MRTKALASALILFGSTAAIAQVSTTQDAPVTNNTQAEESWDNSATEDSTVSPTPSDAPDATPADEPTDTPSETDPTTPPTDPTPQG